MLEVPDLLLLARIFQEISTGEPSQENVGVVERSIDATLKLFNQGAIGIGIDRVSPFHLSQAIAAVEFISKRLS